MIDQNYSSTTASVLWLKVWNSLSRVPNIFGLYNLHFETSQLLSASSTRAVELSDNPVSFYLRHPTIHLWTQLYDYFCQYIFIIANLRVLLAKPQQNITSCLPQVGPRPNDQVGQLTTWYFTKTNVTCFFIFIQQLVHVAWVVTFTNWTMKLFSPGCSSTCS